MDYQLIAQGVRVLSTEALPAVVSSTKIFANAPAATRFATLTVRGGTLVINFNGVATATAGHDYPPDTYDLPITVGIAAVAEAIQQSSAVTGQITYWGR